MGITMPSRFSMIRNSVLQKNTVDIMITLTRSKLAAIRLYTVIAVTMTIATAANIRGNSDLSNCVRKNVSLALDPVILAPTIQKNISIRKAVGVRSSCFVLMKVILIGIEIT